MKKIKLLTINIAIILSISCDNNINEPEIENTSWVFIANEGEFDPTAPTNTGTISMINDFGDVYETEFLGDIVHSLAIYNNQLIVSINNSQKILVFNISEEGLSENYNEILTEESPREIIIINNKAYFTTWNPDYNIYPTINGYIKVLDLQNFQIKESIEVGIMPEGMLFHDNYLWVANSGESSVSKIDIESNLVIETIEVGDGPQNLAEYNGDIYISRTYYDQEWHSLHGTSKIYFNGSAPLINDYGSGLPCGGSVMNYNNEIYRSYEGGISPIDENLNINSLIKIGDYDQSKVYHVEIIDNNIWFALTNYTDFNEVRVLDVNGIEIASYQVGTLPGDFTKWKK